VTLPGPGLIDIRNLRKTFPNGTQALRGIDLRIDRPGIFGVVGPDGAGKTTLLRTLVGIMGFEADRVEVLGHRLPEEALAVKRASGYLPQIWGLYRDMTIGQNLRFFATLRGIPEEEFRARKAELLEATDLARFEHRAAGLLSGGMKQKLSIACALLHRPRLLVLDEPNNGVDIAARQEIWDMLSRDADRLVIISTNYIDEAARCDELVYLFQGRALVRGTPAAIIERHGSRTNGYRVIGRNLGALADAVEREPWIVFARFKGDAVEIEAQSLPPGEVERRLRAHPAGGDRIALIEPHRPDLEEALHALTQEAARRPPAHAA
jgi:ABC-2 type transport system ATP-binding protein